MPQKHNPIEKPDVVIKPRIITVLTETKVKVTRRRNFFELIVAGGCEKINDKWVVTDKSKLFVNAGETTSYVREYIDSCTLNLPSIFDYKIFEDCFIIVYSGDENDYKVTVSGADSRGFEDFLKGNVDKVFLKCIKD